MLKFIKKLKQRKLKRFCIKINRKYNYLKIIGIFGNIKLKILSKNNKLFINNLLFFDKIFYTLVLGLNYGWFLCLELLGRGFSSNFYKNVLKLNIGYSHGIGFLLSKDLKVFIKKKKKDKIYFFSYNLVKLKILTCMVKKFRLLDNYKGKGIKFENEFIKLKVGKRV